MPRSKIQNVLRYLARCRDACGDPWEADDYQIAWLTVLYCKRGLSDPHVRATRKVLGVHPDQLSLKLAARDEAWLHKTVQPVAKVMSKKAGA